MDTPIYLDYAASTPLSRYVAQAMADFLQSPAQMGNPSSTTHTYGWEAQEIVSSARGQVADLLGCRANEIIFTSGATEANNLAIQGICGSFLKRSEPVHIITSSIEHKAVLTTCEALEKQGVEVTYLAPNQEGLISLEQIALAQRPHTRLISVMWVNNELGNINDIRAIGEWASSQQVIFHVDAAQGAGKITLNDAIDTIDLLSVSGHKLYGPKGIGALVVKRRHQQHLAPVLFGGAQERGLRPGTLATHQIFGFGQACELLAKTQNNHSNHIDSLADVFLNTLSASGVDFALNSTTTTQRYPGIINLHFAGVDSDLLLMGLPELAFSTGSACNSAQQFASHVIAQTHPERVDTGANVRISFGLMLSQQEAQTAAQLLADKVAQLRALDE